MSVLWSLDGRLGRLDYFLYSLATLALHGMLFVFVIAAPVLLLPIYISLAVSSWSLTVRRAHDLNHSWAWTLLYLIPVVDFVICIMLTFFRGTDGPNDYGVPKGWNSYLQPTYQPVMSASPGLVQIGVDERGYPVYGLAASSYAYQVAPVQAGERMYDFADNRSLSGGPAHPEIPSYANRNPRDVPAWKIAG